MSTVNNPFSIPLATQGEAEAGSDNVKYMSALRVAQAIDAQAGSAVWGAITGTIGNQSDLVAYVKAAFNWIPKTNTYTAVAGEKIAADTNGGAWTLTLPASPSNGDTVMVLDARGTFDSNGLTLGRNSQNINGAGSNVALSTEWTVALCVFNSTYGWRVFTLAPSSGGGAVWGAITGTLSDQTDLQAALDAIDGMSDPSVAYVRSDGDDGTGDGTPSKPFATFQAAVNAASNFTSFDFGVGSFGDGDFTARAANISLSVTGRGSNRSDVGTLLNGGHNITIIDVGVNSLTIATLGTYKSGSHSGSVTATDIYATTIDTSGGSTGKNAGTLTISGLTRVSGNVLASGGNGDGGNAGGNGGALTVQGPCVISAISLSGGTNGGAGAGTDGTATFKDGCNVPTPTTTNTVTITGSTVNNVFRSASPWFNTVDLGAASDTTLSRVSAGDIAVEGNRVFRVGGSAAGTPCEIGIACSDETTALTTGTAKVTFRMPWAMTLNAVRSSLTTAATGSTFIIDLNESGTTVLSTKLSIDASEKTSTTAATPAVISDSALADDAEMTVDFDQVGSTIAGAGAKLWLIGVRA